MAVNLKTRRSISDKHIDKETGTRAYGESLKEWFIAPRQYFSLSLSKGKNIWLEHWRTKGINISNRVFTHRPEVGIVYRQGKGSC